MHVLQSVSILRLIPSVIVKNKITGSDWCLHGLDVFGPIEIDVYEITLAEVVASVLEQVVLSEAALEANALLSIEVMISHSVDLEGALAVRNGIAQSLGEGTLLKELIELLLSWNSLYHYFFVYIIILKYNNM